MNAQRGAPELNPVDHAGWLQARMEEAKAERDERENQISCHRARIGELDTIIAASEAGLREHQNASEKDQPKIKMSGVRFDQGL